MFGPEKTVAASDDNLDFTVDFRYDLHMVFFGIVNICLDAINAHGGTKRAALWIAKGRFRYGVCPSFDPGHTGRGSAILSFRYSEGLGLSPLDQELVID
jgi:hypothetical protein